MKRFIEPIAFPVTVPGENKNKSIYDKLYKEVTLQRKSIYNLKTKLEKELIIRALEDSKGNIAAAARVLGMKRPRLSQIVNSDDNLKIVLSIT